VPELKERYDEVNAVETDTTRATARVLGLDIEIVHRRAVAGDSKEISIHLRAAPSFEAFGRALQAANPLTFWVQSAQLAWFPWLEAARALALPWPLALPRPSGEPTSRSAQERASPG